MESQYKTELCHHFLGLSRWNRHKPVTQPNDFPIPELLIEVHEFYFPILSQCQLIWTFFCECVSCRLEICALLEVFSDVDWYSAVAQEALKLEPHHYFCSSHSQNEDCIFLYSYLMGDLSFEYLKPIWKEVDGYPMAVDKKLDGCPYLICCCNQAQHNCEP